MVELLEYCFCLILIWNENSVCVVMDSLFLVYPINVGSYSLFCQIPTWIFRWWRNWAHCTNFSNPRTYGSTQMWMMCLLINLKFSNKVNLTNGFSNKPHTNYIIGHNFLERCVFDSKRTGLTWPKQNRLVKPTRFVVQLVDLNFIYITN